MEAGEAVPETERAHLLLHPLLDQQPIPNSGNGRLAPSTVTKLDAALRPAYNSTSLMIGIPVIKGETCIVGVQLKDGVWDVSWLQNQVE